MNRILVLLSMGFLMISCGGLEGTLSVNKSFNLMDRKGKTHQIDEGRYDVNLVYKESKHRLNLTFKETQETIEIQTPDNFVIPENGTFVLSSQDSGQSVDIKGEVETTQRRSQEMLDRQSCNYTGYEPVCTTGPNGQTSCTTAAVTKWGWQDVRYYNLETRQRLNSDFLERGYSVGKFSADNTWVERRETYRGQCW